MADRDGPYDNPAAYPTNATLVLTDLVNNAKLGPSASPGGPVKAACLSCRQKKAKCDGKKPVCGQCEKKDLECIFVKSKRGGARRKRDMPPPSALQEFLKRLDGLMDVKDYNLSPGVCEPEDDQTNVVRTFSSPEEVLRCYYNEVHPYLPVMPPRHYLVDIMPTLQPDSPFLLAAQTIMTLAPHPLDMNARSANSKRLRSAASFALGQQAMNAVESTLDHATSLEVVQALIMLSVWEWGNAGDAKANMQRCGQAIQVAMEMGIHEMDKHSTNHGYALEGIDWHRDAMRRTWWITYVYQLTAALVSGSAPLVGPDDDRVKVDFPVCSAQDRTWSTWINTIRRCSRVIATVNELVYSDAAPGGQEVHNTWGAPPRDHISDEQAAEKRRQMVAADKEIMELMKETERMSVVEHVPGGEEDVVKNQQIGTRLGLAVAHIHIHRHQAFPEVSLFSKRICGLPKAPNDENGTYPVASSSLSSRASSAVNPPYGHAPATNYQDHLQNGPASTTSTGASNTYPGQSQLASAYAAAYAGSTPTGATETTVILTPDSKSFPPSIMAGPPLISPPTISPPHLTPPYNVPPHSLSPQLHYATAFTPQTYSANPVINPYTSPIPSPALIPSPITSHVQGYNSTSYFNLSPNPATGYHSSPSHGDFNPSPVFDSMSGFDATPYELGISDGMWAPDKFPTYLPEPWFAHPHGAASLFLPTSVEPQHVPAIDMSQHLQQYYPSASVMLTHGHIAPAPMSVAMPMNGPGYGNGHSLAQRQISSSQMQILGVSSSESSERSVSPTKPHRAWGVDENGEPVVKGEVDAAELVETFPPGISLARCATAAHAVVRLEVLHRSAAMALSDGPPRWIPFCACGLVSGAYAFLLLALAVQAENTFDDTYAAKADEVTALLTNVKVILAGLEAYGVMWSGIDLMAAEVRAALEAATRLPVEVQNQLLSSPQQQ